MSLRQAQCALEVKKLMRTTVQSPENLPLSNADPNMLFANAMELDNKSLKEFPWLQDVLSIAFYLLHLTAMCIGETHGSSLLRA